MSDNYNIRSVIYHMEIDRMDDRNILMSDGAQIKRYLEISRSITGHTVHQQPSRVSPNTHTLESIGIGFDPKSGDDTFGTFCEQVQDCCANCPFGSCHRNNKCSFNHGSSKGAAFMKITGFTQITARHIVLVDSGNNCLRLVHRTSSSQSYTYPFLGLCNNDVRGLNDARKRSQVRFNVPWAITQEPNSRNLLVTDSGNDALRLIKIDHVTLQPLYTQTLSYMRLHNPTEMSWSPDGAELLISNFHFISKIKILDVGSSEQSVLAGTALPGDKEGILHNSTFEQPIGIHHITNTVVAVADYYNCKIKVIDRMAQNVTALNLFQYSRHGEYCHMPVSLLVKDEKLYIGGLRKLYTVNISGLPQTDTANDSLFKGFIQDDSTFSSDQSQFSMEGGESPKLNYTKSMGTLTCNSPAETGSERQRSISNQCPESIREVADINTGKAEVRLPMAAAMTQTIQLPVGSYLYNTVFTDQHGHTHNCSLSVTIFDSRIKRRADFTASYDVDCEVYQQAHVHTVIEAMINQSYPQIDEICDTGCSMSPDTLPYTSCSNNTLNITWPSDRLYNGSIITIPNQLQATVSAQLSCRRTVLPLLILGKQPQMVYPRKAFNESGLKSSLTSYCDFGDGKHTPLDDVNIPSCEQTNN